jgi:hypothetical protein
MGRRPLRLGVIDISLQGSGGGVEVFHEAAGPVSSSEIAKSGCQARQQAPIGSRRHQLAATSPIGTTWHSVRVGSVSGRRKRQKIVPDW